MPKFSVITPFHIWSDQREQDFYRCLKSVNVQTVKDYEHILVDDGSNHFFAIPTEDPNIKFIPQLHLERVMAYNKAFENAAGEWFVLVDSDDELVPDALSFYEDAIATYPKQRMFNFATMFASKEGPDKDWVRGPFEPKKKKVGHEVFGGGNIVNGSFIWHRSVYEDLGGFPDNCYNRRHKMHLGKNMAMTSPWDFSIRFQELHPEIKPMFEVTNPEHPKGYPRELGNPWGQDFALFYQYTRKYQSLPLNVATHIIHPR